MSKDKIIAFLALALILSSFLAGAFFFSNSNLKAEILMDQEAAEKRIADLEKMVNQTNGGKVPEETQPVDNKDPLITPPSTGSPEFMSEEELLKNYFAEPPTLIMPGETPKGEAPRDATGPILTVIPEVFDLGTISKVKGIAEAKFELKNTGKSDLTINYALTSCGCTLAPLKEEKILKPGESYLLPVSYDPNFYGPDYELGPVEKTVTIFSNYSVQPFYRVKLKANVTP